MEKYIPKVGEECLVFNNELSNAEFEKCTPVFIGVHIIVYNSESCLERVSALTFCEFKPLLTEEESLKDELLSLMNGMAVDCSSLKPNELADKIIKAGYRKVESIHRDEFVRLYYEYDPDDFMDRLIKHNHIIAK